MRKGIVVLLALLVSALSVGVSVLMASGTPNGTPSSFTTENFIGNRGMKLSWDARHITGATSWDVEARKFPEPRANRPAIVDNEVDISGVFTSSDGRKYVELYRLRPGAVYEFLITPRNSSGAGNPGRVEKTAPSPSYTRGHQADHTVLYKHGTFVDDWRTEIQSALPGAARAWSGVVTGLSVCKDSSSCRGKNTDGGIITVKSVATTDAADTSGCGKKAFACVTNWSTTGSSTAIGKHIDDADMVFEAPGYSCPDGETPCTQTTKWQWVSTGNHGRTIKATPTLKTVALRADYIALHEFGHTFGLPDYYKRSGTNWDSRLSNVTAIMNVVEDATRIRNDDSKQLEAIYVRHTKH